MAAVGLGLFFLACVFLLWRPMKGLCAGDVGENFHGGRGRPDRGVGGGAAGRPTGPSRCPPPRSASIAIACSHNIQLYPWLYRARKFRWLCIWGI